MANQTVLNGEAVKEEVKVMLGANVKESDIKIEKKNDQKGEASWKTDYWKSVYEKKVNEVPVYPTHPRDITVGSVLKMRPIEELEILSAKDEIPCGWCSDISKLFEAINFSLEVTKEVRAKIEANDYLIAEFDATEYCETQEGEKCILGLSLPMFYVETFGRKTRTRKETKQQFSIRQKEHDPAIIEEMKSKVDFKRFNTLLSMAASGQNDKVWVKKEVVEKYLDMWANAKYEFYLMFGRQLTIDQEVEFDKTEREMGIAKKELASKFPAYGIYLDEVRNSDLINNKFSGSCPSYCNAWGSQYYVRGIKVTKFFKDFCQNPEFDLALSRVLQDKKVKGIVSLSIDPYDYLTSSINKAGWASCHRIADSSVDGGEWGTGSVAYMIDDATIVSYRSNKQDYTYNFFNMQFEGNSKLHRMLVYMDKDSCNFITSRQYPDNNQKIQTTVRNMLQEIISNYTGCGLDWVKCFERYEGNYYVDRGDYHYGDVSRYAGAGYIFTRPANSKENVMNLKVGVESLPCAVCMSKIERHGSRLVCRNHR